MRQAEKRAAPRVTVNIPATIQVLGASPAENTPPAAAQIVDTSGRGLRLQVPSPLAPGRIVKIETADTMILGEVCYCGIHAGQGYVIGIAADQCLTGVSDLEHLIRALAPEPANEFQRR